MANAKDRRLGWPIFAGRARRRTEQTAEDYGEIAQRVLDLLRQIEQEAHDNPDLVRDLAIVGQRDVALMKSAFADIRSWMVDAQRGRPPGE